jgi:glycosyltransferase involved in cell wall biosynthesis
VWTVHNVLPHETRFPAADARLQQALADRADIVHLLTRATVPAAAGSFSFREDTLLHVPAPSYRGAYPDTVGRAEARQRLGIEPDAQVSLLLGGLRKYKGLGRLLPAFDEVHRRDPRAILLVAGRSAPDRSMDDTLREYRHHPGVRLHLRRLTDAELAVHLRAADVVVLPYDRVLNSGVLHLALTFGLGVVAPLSEAIREVADDRVVTWFDPGRHGSLAEALRTAPTRPRDEIAAAAAELMDRLDPATLSGRFVGALRARFGTPPDTRGTAPVASGGGTTADETQPAASRSTSAT